MNLKSMTSGSSFMLKSLDHLFLLATSDFKDLGLVSTDVEGVQSLKMYFREIKMCTDLSFAGSGYTISGTCVSMYTNDSDAYSGTEAPTAADRATFEAAGSGKFYDVLSEAGRAGLRQSVTVTPGIYKYGIVETHPWVKMKAKADNICTKSSGNSEVAATGGGVTTYSTQNSNLECGSGNPEEATVYITNANTTFAFLKPFVVAEGDSVELDLAFNLNGEVKGVVAGGSTARLNYKIDASTDNRGFYIPMIKMSPAPRKTGETTKTETYVLTNASGKDKIRIILYYNSADTTKSVLAVNATVLSGSSSTKSKANTPIYSYKASQTGDVLSLKSWDDSSVLSFTRFVAGTPTLNCASGNSGGTAALEDCEGTWSYAEPAVADL